MTTTTTTMTRTLPRSVVSLQRRWRPFQGKRQGSLTVLRLVVYLSMLVCLSGGPVVGSETSDTERKDGPEITWKPNDRKKGPLPQSQQLRDQLMELDRVISQSSDPQQALVRAAQANQMDPQELVQLLVQNRQEMQQLQRQENFRQQALVKFFSFVSVLGRGLWKMARQHPSRLAAILLGIYLLLQLAWQIPRTGLVVSSPVGSKGHSTFWAPPRTYVDRYPQTPRVQRLLADASGAKVNEWKDLISQNAADMLQRSKRTKTTKVVTHPEDEGSAVTVTYQVPREKDVAFVVTARQAVKLPHSSSSSTGRANTSPRRDSNDADEKTTAKGKRDEENQLDNNKGENDARLDLAWDTAWQVLQDLRLTEFVSSHPPLSFHAWDDDDENDDKQKSGGLLVAKGWGDWGRFALLPLTVLSSEDSIWLATADFWETLLELTVEEQDDQLWIVVRLWVASSSKKKKPSRGVAQSWVARMAQSLSQSASAQVAQQWTRLRQSQHYQLRAQQAGKARLQRRARLTQDLESMSRKRATRQRRGGLAAGERYRPSGRRMQSPNHC